MKIICLALFWILVFAGFTSSAQNSKVDSILTTILDAKDGAHMNSIQTVVSPKILALNNFANNAAWNEPDLVKEVAEGLISYALSEKNDSLLAWSTHYLGLSYYNMHYSTLSIETYEKALALAWTKNSPSAGSFRAFCTLNIGCNYEFLGEFDKAASYYYSSIRMNEDLGVPYVAAEAKLDVASLNIRMNNPEEARKNILEALDALREFGDSVRVSEGYRMLSSIEIYEKNYNEAEKFFKQALDIAMDLNDGERLVKIYQDYGDALFSQRFFLRALETYKKAMDYCAPSVFPASYFHVKGSMGKAQVELELYVQAEENLISAHKGLSKLLANSLLLELEQSLTNLYAKKGDYEQFQYYFGLSVARKDTLAAIEKLRSIGESEVIYRTAQKDRQIEIQNLRIRNRNTQILFISVIALFFLLGFVVVLQLLRDVRIKNIELLERNLELSQRWDQIQNSYFSNDSLDGDTSLFKGIYDLVAGKQEYINPRLSVDYLARELKSNNKYVSNAIKEKTGMNFNAFVNTFRIEKAKNLLRGGNSNKWSLEVIAENCGFNNHTTFYQTFKRNTGLTPSAFRKIRS